MCIMFCSVKIIPYPFFFLYFLISESLTGLLKYLSLAYLHFFEKISFCTVMSLFEVKIVSLACASTCRIDTVDSTVEIKSTPA
jgi:hypothetical protein